jgi:hypothetical protein
LYFILNNYFLRLINSDVTCLCFAAYQMRLAMSYPIIDNAMRVYEPYSKQSALITYILILSFINKTSIQKTASVHHVMFV